MLLMGAASIEKMYQFLAIFSTHFSSIEPILKLRLMLRSIKFEISYEQHLFETLFISNQTFKSNFIFVCFAIS